MPRTKGSRSGVRARLMPQFENTRRTHGRMTNGEIKALVDYWILGASLEDLIEATKRLGKPRDRKYLRNICTGRILKAVTKLERSPTYLEACGKYQKPDPSKEIKFYYHADKDDSLFEEWREDEDIDPIFEEWPETEQGNV